MPCENCGSHAINHHCHGRDGSDGHLCDVCYWRKRAQRKPLTAVQVQNLVVGVCDSIYPQDDAAYSQADSVFYCAFAHAIEAAHGIGASDAG